MWGGMGVMADLKRDLAAFMKDVGFLEFRVARNWRGCLVRGAGTGEERLRRYLTVGSYQLGDTLY